MFRWNIICFLYCFASRQLIPVVSYPYWGGHEEIGMAGKHTISAYESFIVSSHFPLFTMRPGVLTDLLDKAAILYCHFGVSCPQSHSAQASIHIPPEIQNLHLAWTFFVKIIILFQLNFSNSSNISETWCRALPETGKLLFVYIYKMICNMC